MSVLIVEANDAGSTSSAVLTTPQPGDVVVVLAITTSSNTPSATTVAGLGATWTRAWIGAETSLWIGKGATAAGAITVNNSSGTMWALLRGLGTDTPAVSVWENYAFNIPLVTPLLAPVVTVHPTQAAFAFFRRAATHAGEGATAAEWQSVAGSNSLNNGLAVAPAVTGSYSTSSTWTTNPANERWHVQFVVGNVPPPQPPTGLTQTAATLSSVTLGWAPPASGPAPSSYELRVDGGVPLDVGLVTSYTLSDLPAGTSRLVEVRTVSAAGVSSWAEVTATTLEEVTREWVQHPFVSQTLLATAGLDVEADQPAFQWHDYAAGWALDELRSRSLIGWQVTTGRPSPRDTVPPTAVTVQLAAWGAYADAGLPQLGQRFRLALSPVLTALGIAESDLPRFTGEVTDVDLDTSSRVLTVTGVGRIARKGRLPVDGTGWPTEREGARVGRILAAIGADAGALDAGPTGLDLAAHTAPAPAAQLVEQISSSTTGQLVERRDGALDWHDANHRRDTAVALDLDATELLRGFRWSQRVGDLVNAATVKWAAGEVLVEDTASIAERERYPVSLDTLLTRPGMAQAIGGLIVGRYSRPVWLLPAVMLDVTRTMLAADVAAVLALAHAAKVQLLDLPAGGPYAERTVYVEGVTETLTPRAWRLTLTVSDERLSGAPIRWRDVPAGVRWTDVRDGFRWLDAAKVQDPAELT